MPLENAGRHAALGGLASAATYISLHGAIPNSSGSNELVGGSYARKQVIWDSPASGAMANDGALSHNVPAGSTVACYGLWSALTTGTYYGYVPLNGSPRGFGSVDATDVTNDTITSNGHGLANDQRVFVTAVNAEPLPTGLAAGTLYYVINATTDTFKLSTTSGGSAVNLTAVGELWWQRLIPEVYGAAGTLETADGALALDLTAL